MEPDAERQRHRERGRVMGVCGERETEKFPKRLLPSPVEGGVVGEGEREDRNHV